MEEYQTINIQGINILVEFRDDTFTDKQIIVFIEPISFTKFAVLVSKPTTATEAVHNMEYAITRYLPELDKIRQTIDINEPYFQFRNHELANTTTTLNWNSFPKLVNADYLKNAVVEITKEDEENELLQKFDNANQPLEDDSFLQLLLAAT